MIFKTVKLAIKVATIASAASTGYSIYKKGRKIYSGYQKAKKVSNTVSDIAEKATNMIKGKK